MRGSGLRLFDAALFVYAGLIPFESLTVGSGGLARAWGLVVAVVGLFAIWRISIAPRMASLLLAPVVLSALSVFWSIDPDASVARTATFASLAGIALLVVGLGTQRTIRAAIYGLLAGGVAASYFVRRDYQQLQLSVATEIRSTTAGANANDLAAVLAVAAALGLGMALLASGRRATWLCSLGAATCAAASILTASRTAAASLALVAAVAIVLRGGNWRRRSFLLAGLGGAFWYLLPRIDQRITGRLVGAYQAASAGDLNFRTFYWRIGWERITERPFVGWGAGTFPSLVGDELHRVGAAHSALVDLASDLGVLGVITLAALVGAAGLGICACHDPQLRLALTLGGLVLGVNMLLLSWDYRKLPWLFLALALLAGGSRLRDRVVDRDEAEGGSGGVEDIHLGDEGTGLRRRSRVAHSRASVGHQFRVRAQQARR